MTIRWRLNGSLTILTPVSTLLTVLRYKTVAFDGLFYRAKLISSQHLDEKAVSEIVKTFQKNGFPDQLIFEIKYSAERKLQSEALPQQQTTKSCVLETFFH